MRGAVITPTEAWTDGYVIVEGQMITAVRKTTPEGVQIIDTGGVILPGPSTCTATRNSMCSPPGNRRSSTPTATAGATASPITNWSATRRTFSSRKLPPGTELRYAEIRALIGGVTAIQGAGGVARKADTEPMVRNVDRCTFGQHRVCAMIDLPSGTSGQGYATLQRYLAAIGAGTVDAFYLHLCEGQRGDPRSDKEFARFLQLGAGQRRPPAAAGRPETSVWCRPVRAGPPVSPAGRRGQMPFPGGSSRSPRNHNFHRRRFRLFRVRFRSAAAASHDRRWGRSP